MAGDDNQARCSERLPFEVPLPVLPPEPHCHPRRSGQCEHDGGVGSLEDGPQPRIRVIGDWIAEPDKEPVDRHPRQPMESGRLGPGGEEPRACFPPQYCRQN